MDDSLSAKQLQAWLLVIRNKKYNNEVARIRNKYGVGQQNVDTDYYYALDDTYERLESTDFESDIKELSARINATGVWDNVVRYHVLGFDTDMLAYSLEDQKEGIEVKKNDGFIEVRFYGDMTIPQLRSHLKTIRKAIIEQQSSAHSPKYKPQLSKNLMIYDLAQQNWKPQKIAEYINEHTESVLNYSDVGRYIEATKEQIEKIVA